MTNDSLQETISTRVMTLIRHHIGEEVELTPDTDLLNDLAIDSIELVELGITVEKEFGTRFFIGDLRRCATVEDLIHLSQKTLSEAQVGNI